MIAITANSLKFLLINFNNDLKVKSLLINNFGLKLRQMYENKKAYDKPIGRKLHGPFPLQFALGEFISIKDNVIMRYITVLLKGREKSVAT